MKQYQILIYLFCFLSIISFSQNTSRIDSLQSILSSTEGKEKVKVLNKLSFSLQENNAEKALDYANEALRLASDINDIKGIAFANKNLGIYQYHKGYHEQSEEYYIKSLAHYRGAEDSSQVAVVLTYIGYTYRARARFVEAIKYYKQSLAIYELLNDQKHAAATLIGVGNAYLSMGRYQKALENYFRSLKLRENIEDQTGITIALKSIADVYRLQKDYTNALDIYQKVLGREISKSFKGHILNNFGAVYALTEDYEKAMNYYQQSLDIFTQMGNSSLMAYALNNIGQILALEDKYSDAIDHYFRAERLSKEMNDEQGLVLIYRNLGSAYMSMGNSKKSSFYYFEALKIAKELGLNKEANDVYKNLAKLYVKQKDYQKAFKYQQLYSVTTDSLFNENKTRAIQELKTIYETEKKEQEIRLKNHEIRILEQENKVKELRNYVTIILVILILTIGGFLYYQQHKKRENERIQFEKEISFQNKRVMDAAQHLSHKNLFLQKIKELMGNISISKGEKYVNNQVALINQNIDLERNRTDIYLHKSDNEDFYSRIKEKYPGLTENELQLIALLRMNLSTKEIAVLLNIAIKSVESNRYRLRKKLKLDSDKNLSELIREM